MTPLMRQYHDIKQRYQEAILLFQVGDFYEIFYTDAQRVAPVLGILLTSRGSSEGEPIPLCGFPRHTVDTYLAKLVSHGFRVVLCDQATAPEQGKIIERVVSQVITPGTVTDSKLLDEKSASYVAVIAPGETTIGLWFIEILTGKIFTTQLLITQKKLLESELARFMPQEVIVPAGAEGAAYKNWLIARNYVVTVQTAHHGDDSAELLARLEMPLSSKAIELTCLQQGFALLHTFLTENNPRVLLHMTAIDYYEPEDFLILDAATQRNLEIVKNNQDATIDNTLFAVLDYAATSMGSRTIKKWLLRPLVAREALDQRHDIVENLVKSGLVREHLAAILKGIGDIERVVGRIALQRASLRDYVQLLRMVGAMPALLQTLGASPLRALGHEVATCQQAWNEIHQLLAAALYDESTHEWRIKAGYHEELDRLRRLVEDGSQAILALEQREQAATGISSLKIRFSNSQGYGIEVTKPNLLLVPEHYTRLQILTNRERFTTQELKDLEYDIRRAQADSITIEKELYDAVCLRVANYLSFLKKTAQFLAELDAAIGFAEAAVRHNYIRPTMVDSRDMRVVAGRHPVVEAHINAAGTGQFIANDVTLTDAESLWVITGPNMGGKSTFLRQTALTVVMAQAGAFVPAARAELPIFDRIFTRIGAADNVAHGKSTFWVEMEETALICHEATEKSLVILDEVGRGTSTYDGLAIAQAVVEHIYTNIKARCLFATHYHELTELTLLYQGIVAYHAVSKSGPEGITLLHQIRKGCAQGSFGIEVAKSAQLPDTVIVRAQQILAKLHQVEK